MPSLGDAAAVFRAKDGRYGGSSVIVLLMINHDYQYVPHKAVAEVSKIGNL